MSPCVSHYNNIPRFNVKTEIYNWYFPNVKLSIISSQHLRSSTFVSYVYGLMRHILYQILVAPYYNVIIPLSKTSFKKMVLDCLVRAYLPWVRHPHFFTGLSPCFFGPVSCTRIFSHKYFSS